MTFCYVHKDQAAQTRCERCNKWICSSCIRQYDQYDCQHTVCAECYEVLMKILREFEGLDLL